MLERLFEPLQIGPVVIPNRIVSTAHQTTLVSRYLPTDDFVAYHEARAVGGVGLIVMEATTPHPSGLLTDHQLGGYLPEIVDAFGRVADAVRSHGTRLFCQLLHSGREQIAGPPRAPAVAPSAIPSQRFRSAPRALRPDEIDEIVAGFATSAQNAADAGLDGVEISAAHRYLVAQFFDPELNRRDDEWAEPTRFLRAVIEAVRAAAPGLCVGVRLSADSDAARAIAPTLGELVDYVSIALGDSPTYLGSVGIVPPPPTPENAIEAFTAPFRVGPPLIATSRVVDPAEADRLVAAGVADALGMTRALIADPALPVKARAGRTGEILRCIACQACIAHYHAAEGILCAINPRTGRERTWEPVRTGSGRLVVVGAGPAGLTAAAEGLAAGFDVVVLERSDVLGGQLALVLDSPGASLIAHGFLSNHEATIAGVDLRTGVEATLETVTALDPTCVVVATGARPYEPPLARGGVRVLQAWEALAAPSAVTGRVVVADWGGDQAGLDAAEALALAGADVLLATSSVAVGESVHQYRRNLYLQRLYRAGVEIRQHREVAGVENETVVLRNAFAPEREEAVPADALVLALGRVPEDALAPALRTAGLRVEEAGDCLSPRGLEEAILEAALAVRRLVA